MRMLLLVGASESTQIAQALAREDRVIATASQARAGRTPLPLQLPTRIGGWGGRSEFATWLEREGVEAVLDATHPFAARISMRTCDVCRELGVPYIQFLRPQWTPGDDDRWEFLNREEDAELHIPPGARVLLGTGRRKIERFNGLAEGRTLVSRVNEPVYMPFPYPPGRFVLRPAAGTVAAEEAFLHDLGIDWIVARNSGGGTSAGKLEAARRLGIPIAMIRRPPQPEAMRIHTISEALAWVRRRL
ncbi:MAG: cobalt-precorrin-6A reductase [Rhodobacteraceae bacterium]|nr:precorrin-6A/cobalt-precorrin-6A reductase [Alphaproteobacteria bacterium]NNF73019.1 cobalt-precorrin-6A reductase [Paracoccaceae bacterium]NNK66653.1 cobalt-precorrin-6A reductase [Paracoccaceae bacterium]